MPLLSVIIPVYNVEDYLHQCIESVLCQSVKDLEIILVNDGSSDKSPEICDLFKKRDSRIKVIHKQNGGQAAARNDGLRVATGEYVVFLDSDDYWLPNALEGIITKSILKANLDLVMFDYCCLKGNNEKLLDGEHKINFNNDIYDAENFLLELLKQNPNFNWYPVLYLVRRDLLISHNLFFEDGIVYEDVNWVYKMILMCEKIMVINKVLYSYRMLRAGSTSNTYKYKTESMKLDVVCNNILWVEEKVNNINLRRMLCNNISCLFYSSLILLYHINKSDRKEMYRKIKEARWVCKYTYSTPQRLIYYMQNLIGIKNISRILFVRSKLKKY